MTGFLAVIDHAVDVSSEAVNRARLPGTEALRRVFASARVVIFASDDLPYALGAASEDIVVGDVSLREPDAIRLSLSQQRVRGVEAVAREYWTAGDVRAGIAEDFHYVVWDAERSRLVAGRDGLGVRPLFYSRLGSRLWIGSAVRFLLAAGAPERIDEGSVERFVVGRPPQAERTYLDTVRRVLPGHQLRWSAEQGLDLAAVEAPIAPPRPWSGGDAVQAFRAAFDAAVATRVARPEETATLLSGGLDSSAISALVVGQARARDLPAPRTLSLVFDATPQWSERPFITAVLEALRLPGDLLNEDEPAPFADFDARLAEHGGLFPAPGLMIGRNLYQAAAAQGRTVLLDGHGGDEVVSYGWGRLHTLAQEGRWRLLWSELKGIAEGSGDARPVLFVLYFAKYGPLRRWVSRAVRLRRAVERRIGKRSATPETVALVAASRRQTLAAALAETSEPEIAGTAEARRHYAIVSAPQQAMAMETLHAAASALGVIPRYPFWDRSLLELCLALPDAEKLDQGLARLILRRAMPELPGKVRWRTDKLDFTPHLARGLLNAHGTWLAQLVRRQPEARVWSFVDQKTAQAHLERLEREREQTSGAIVQALWRVGALALWLDDLAAREGSPDASAGAIEHRGEGVPA